MGVSFKILKTGKRFRPKPPTQLSSPAQEPGEKTNGETAAKHEVTKAVERINHYLVSSPIGGQCISTEHEVSFTLNLLPDGFFIGNPNEVAKAHNFLQEAPKLLHPYTRASEAMFSAIESGWLPGDILDDIPSKYVNGTLLCEVRDYRKCLVEQGSNPSVGAVPNINKVLLRMSLENIVKDIPSISDGTWTYSDLMEVESRILKAVQPQLCLDPTPMLDRLCSDPVSLKLNVNMYGGKRKRSQPVTDVIVTSNSQTNGKKVSIDRRPENASHETADFRNIVSDVPGPRVYDNMSTPHVASGMQLLQPKYDGQEASMPALNSSSQTSQFQTSVKHIRINQDGFPKTQASMQQNVINAYSENVSNSVPYGKRDNQDMQQPDISNLKRSRQTPILQEGNRFAGLQGDGHIRADMHMKSAFLQQIDAKAPQFPGNIPEQKYFTSVMNDITNPTTGQCFYQNQQGVKLGIKQEQMETDKLEKQNFEKTRKVLQTVDPEILPVESQQLNPQHTRQSFGKTQFQSQQQWHNSGFASERDSRKDDILPKRRTAQSPRVSAGPSIQSAVSSRSAELSTGSFGGQFGALTAITAGAPTGSQKEKAVPHSNAVATPVVSSPSDSLQRHAKRKTNSIPKAHSISGVASPASVSNVSASQNAGSPSVVAAPGGDLALLERFTKIETLTKRFKLVAKKNKVENANSNVSRQVTYKPQELSSFLSSSLNTEDVMDSEWPMSKSLMGGTVNNCKTRILNCARPIIYQGSGVSVPARTCYRLVLTEKPNDGTVIMQYGDMDESDNPSQDCLLILPNTHFADLLASQFRLLMERDGYQVIDDQIRPNAARTGMVTSPSCATGISASDNVVQQGHPLDGIPNSQSNIPALINDNMNHLNSAQNISSIRMLPPGQAHALPMPQGYLPGGGNPTLAARTQMDQTMLQQQQQQQLQNQQSQMQQQLQPQQQLQQQQQLQMQRSSSMLRMSPISQLMGQSSMQIPGNQMASKPTHLQLQAFQQQAQQQQQTQFPTKVGVMGLGSMGNMMGLGGLSNVMSAGGVRGIASSMAAVPGLNNINPNQMNLGSAANFVGLRPGSLSTVHAAALASKLRMVAQNRGNLFGAQSNITGLPGNNSQMLPSSVGLSMLGQSLNRPNINSLQRTAMTPMGPPKIPGANIYMNQQLHLQQQQLQQQQQQQISSPLQMPQVSSPSVVASSQAISQHQQQQISPQHMSQQEIAMSPQQLSAGAMQQINNGGGAGPGPASPQLSSQTHGSVGSISSSPLEQLQGPNKGVCPGNT